MKVVVPLSELAAVLEAHGGPKKQTIYKWKNENKLPGKLIEDGEQFALEVEFKELVDWMIDQLPRGGKGVVERVIEGIPLEEYRRAISDLMKAKEELARKEAEISRLKERESRALAQAVELEKQVKELGGQINELKEELNGTLKEVERLKLKLKLKELEPVLSKLSQEEREKILQAIAGEVK
jgi:seryl-tRNA synthetase